VLENHQFCDHCPGCRPALVDPLTGKLLPDDSPITVAVNKIWDTNTTYDERKAFIEVTLHNSRNLDDLRLARAVMDKVGKAAKELAL
jgi:hypothetical protein